MFIQSNRNFIILTVSIILCGIILSSLVSPKAKKQTELTPGSIVHWGTNKETEEHGSEHAEEILWIKNVKKLAAGHDHMLILTNDGEAYALGSNTFGQVGNETTDFQEDPEKLAFLTKAKDIAASGHHSLAVDEEGTVWAWGLNLSSQLGDGKNNMKVTPQKVYGLAKIKSVAAGYRFSVALQEDGHVVAWGASCDKTTTMDTQSIIRQYASSLMESGGYGDPDSLSSQGYSFGDDCNREISTGINSKTPKVIEGLDNIIKLSSGFGHTMALTSDGTVLMLGCNKYGQIGNGGYQNAFTVEKRNELKDIVDVSAGYRHSLALDKEGNIWSWGANETGQLGDATTTPKLHPTKMNSFSESKVITIAAGYDYSLAKTADGKVWGWGTNASHQVSESDIKESTVPIELEMVQNVDMLAAGGTQAIVTIKE